jgi:hypothetical protein
MMNGGTGGKTRARAAPRRRTAARCLRRSEGGWAREHYRIDSPPPHSCSWRCSCGSSDNEVTMKARRETRVARADLNLAPARVAGARGGRRRLLLFFGRLVGHGVRFHHPRHHVALTSITHSTSKETTDESTHDGTFSRQSSYPTPRRLRMSLSSRT